MRQSWEEVLAKRQTRDNSGKSRLTQLGQSLYIQDNISIFINFLIINDNRRSDTKLSLSRLADAPGLSTLYFQHMD